MTEPIPVGLSNQPYYVRSDQAWATRNRIYQRDQALYRIGEYAMFVMMWKVSDLQAGLVNRCSRCYNTDDNQDRIGSVYNQALQGKCPQCYGTTFDGGIRAKIVRPALFVDADDDEVKGERGVTHPESLSVEATNDFRARSGDFVIRKDGSRYQITRPTRVTLRTGFYHPNQKNDSIGYARLQANLADKSSVVFQIPPNSEEIQTLLENPGNYPAQTADILNGPLIPKSVTD